MRRWLAALCLVPAVAWGQGSDCYSVQLHDFFADMLDSAKRSAEVGVSEREALAVFEESPAPIRAAWHEAILMAYTSRGMGLSASISAMQAACAREDYANRQ